jgi:hypothetical protein
MTEPILTREETLEIAVDAFGIDYDRLDARFENYARAIEAAVLEKVFGEPVFTVQRGDLGTWLRWNQDPTKLPAGTELFALTRSKL